MAISNAVNDGLVVIDSDSQIVFWNKTSETIFGFSFQDVLGLKFSDLIKIDKPIDIKTGQVISRFNLTFDNRFINNVLEFNKNKKYYELSFTLTDIDDEQYLVCIFHDISKHEEEQVILEQQKDELEQLNNLMIGRELKMVELKKLISDSKSKNK
jgi:PAS domain S-box-containing protein